MTREETKKLLHIMQVFADGKTIEYMGINGKWVETDQPVWEVLNCVSNLNQSTGHSRIKKNAGMK